MKRDFASFRLPALVAAASALAALAQSAGRPNHVEPGMRAPQANFQSAFTDYKPFQEQKMLPWKETLDELASVPGGGGHAGHGGKGGMADMAGMNHKGGKPDMPAMAGMDRESGKADMPGKAGMDHKGGKKDMPGMAGMDHKGGKKDMASHGAMGGVRGADSKAAEPTSKAGAHEGHGAMAMARPQTSAPAAKPMVTPTGP